MSVAAVTAGPKRGWRSVSTWVGAAIVVGSGLYLFARERKRA